jgi:anti-sigma B factor antagonist
MAMEQLRVREHRENGVVVLVVSGELDPATGPQLDRQLTALTAAGHHRLVLDVANLTFCDACGITVLLRGHARAREQQGWLRLVAAHPRVRRVLKITALTQVLPVFDCVADAVEGTRRTAAHPTHLQPISSRELAGLPQPSVS